MIKKNRLIGLLGLPLLFCMQALFATSIGVEWTIENASTEKLQYTIFGMPDHGDNLLNSQGTLLIHGAKDTIFQYPTYYDQHEWMQAIVISKANQLSAVVCVIGLKITTQWSGYSKVQTENFYFNTQKSKCKVNIGPLDNNWNSHPLKISIF